MLPIGPTIPRDTESFRTAVSRGLAPLGVAAEAISLQGEFPRFDAVQIDLSGARFHRGLEAPKPGDQRESLCFARAVEIAGQAIDIEGVPVSLSVSAQDVVLAAADAKDGGHVLMLERANGGKLDLSAARAELEKALRAAGQKAAASKGAEVKSVELRLESKSPRTLAVEAIVTAKAMVFTTTVTLAGTVEVDDQLNARLRDLHCEGDGMIGKMAAGALRPQFEQLQQRVFPLGRAVAGLALEDVTLTGGEELRIHATFRSAA